MSSGGRVEVHTPAGVYSGWTRVDIERSLEQASGAFSLGVGKRNTRWLDQFALQEDTDCVVKLNGQAVINGIVEKVKPAITADGRSLSVSGRDATRDLIDCSAQIPNQEMTHVTLDVVAREMLKPYGIALDCPDPGEPFAKIAVNDGESGFEVIEQHARQRGLLCYTSGDRVLHLRQAKPQVLRYRLREGVNILLADAEHDSSGVFSEYTVKSQAHGGQSGVQATATGAGRAGRSLILTAEKAGSDVQARADWEARVRKGRSRRATVTVRGWQFTEGDALMLWQPNLLIWLESPALRFNQAMLVAGVRYSLGADQPELCHLTLVDPDVYAEEPA